MALAREKIPQLGLWDDEVPKLSHDGIVRWAYENAQQLVRAYLEAFPHRDHFDTFSETWNPGTVINNSGLAMVHLPALPEKPTKLHGKKNIEQVIEQYPENSNGRALPRILGYGDLLLTWSAPRVEWVDQQWRVWHPKRMDSSLLVEAKTVMPSLGELMRQLNLYRLVYPDVVVVSPDASYADLLREQGILFVLFKAEAPEPK